MKKKLLMGFSAILIVFIIVIAIIICVKISQKESAQGDNETLIYNEDTNNENNNTDDSNSNTYELITSEEIRKKYNEKLQNSDDNLKLQVMLNSKIEEWDSQSVSIKKFDSGKFSDMQKAAILPYYLDTTEQVEVYDQPAYYIDMKKYQDTSKSLFAEEIDITKLYEVNLREGRIKVYFPTAGGVEILRAVSNVYDKESNQYRLKFDWLRFKEDATNYDKSYGLDDILGTFELIYKKVNNSYILLELNKI